MIPKVIHYCWFGGGELNELSEKCIASWRKFCPDYEIVRWDESNYDVSKNEYMYRSYEAKKWAFVSDYARLDILYEHGGIYLDTDVELIGSLDELLQERAFMGIEYSLCIATGLGIGAEPGVELFRLLRDSYDNASFLREDGSLNQAPCSYYQTELLKKLGYVQEDRRQVIQDVTILPSDILASKDWSYGTYCVTERTVALHHGAATWLDAEQQTLRLRQHALVQKYGRRLGRLLAIGLRGGLYVKKHGVRGLIKRLRGTA